MDSVSNSSPNETGAGDPFPLSLYKKNALALPLSLRSSNSSMASSRVPHWSFLLLLFIFPSLVSSLNSDGTLLLSFKYSVLDDPLSVLSNWNYDDESPCSWNGVTCTGFPDGILNLTSVSRVVGLLLPGARLLGSLPTDLFLLPHLRHLDLSANLLNGSLPSSLPSSAELRVLSLASNEISGDLPDLAAGDLADLQVLNLSDNALGGGISRNLSLLPNLTVVSLRNNFISGEIPGGGFEQVRVFDLSSNLLNGTVPPDLGVSRVQYLNLSYNNISGEIPADVGSRVPASAVVDLSFNNFTGGIPQSAALLAQKPAAFEGNPDLCGKPLRNLCTVPSTLSNPPNVSSSNPPESPPAFAAIPKTTGADGGAAAGSAGRGSGGGGGFKPATIAAIVIGDLGGVGLLFVAFLYAYHIKKKKKRREHHQQQMQEKQAVGFGPAKISTQPPPPPPPESKSRGLCCLRKKDSNTDEETSEATSSGTEADEDQDEAAQKPQSQQNHQPATLVTVDGDVELEMETLLKASAYILGATGSTIVYKAVLADGTALAVRRIGESSAVDKLKDFEATVRSIARFKHPNLLRIWGFYWGPDEKLLIHDYAPNGSLANISFSKKLGSSPFHLSWGTRLRIIRGIARALAYIHDKKSVHGNLKPSNILLSGDMEPKIADFGLDRLMFGDASSKNGASSRLFGSKRSTQSQTSLPDLSPVVPTSSPSIAGPSWVPYQAPESVKNLKSNPKWDVYSFGVVLLELVSGRLFSEEELVQWNAGFVVEERNRIVRMVDPAVRGEIEGREEVVLSCFKLGFACASVAPQRRPSMKDVVVLLERIPSSSSSSSPPPPLQY